MPYRQSNCKVFRQLSCYIDHTPLALLHQVQHALRCEINITPIHFVRLVFVSVNRATENQDINNIAEYWYAFSFAG